jgi:hypothetical protein
LLGEDESPAQHALEVGDVTSAPGGVVLSLELETRNGGLADGVAAAALTEG